MVSRLVANPSIQTIMEPPAGERFGRTKRPSNAPDKQVTNGVVGSVIESGMSVLPRTINPTGIYGTGSLKDYFIYEDMLPGPVRRS